MATARTLIDTNHNTPNMQHVSYVPMPDVMRLPVNADKTRTTTIEVPMLLLLLLPQLLLSVVDAERL